MTSQSETSRSVSTAQLPGGDPTASPVTRPTALLPPRRYVPLAGLLCASVCWLSWSGGDSASPRRMAEQRLLAGPASGKGAADEGFRGSLGEAGTQAGDAEFAEGEELSDEERQRQLLIGHWEDDYQGKRYLHVRADGTATMVVLPPPLGRVMFAPRLQFEIEWSLADGQLSLLTTGGEPRGKVKMILKLYGDRAVQPVLELTDEKLVLLDADGETRYNWVRSTADAEAVAAADE